MPHLRAKGVMYQAMLRQDLKQEDAKQKCNRGKHIATELFN